MPQTNLTVCINPCTELGRIGPDVVVVLIVDTEFPEDAAGGVSVGVGGVGAGGPAGGGGSTEVRAVVPGGGGQGAGLRGIVGDGSSGPHGGPDRELREVGDVGELEDKKIETDACLVSDSTSQGGWSVCTFAGVGEPSALSLMLSLPCCLCDSLTIFCVLPSDESRA